jgi:hypothetical protein
VVATVASSAIHATTVDTWHSENYHYDEFNQKLPGKSSTLTSISSGQKCLEKRSALCQLPQRIFSSIPSWLLSSIPALLAPLQQASEQVLEPARELALELVLELALELALP